jgi:hypothetical protein
MLRAGGFQSVKNPEVYFRDIIRVAVIRVWIGDALGNKGVGKNGGGHFEACIVHKNSLRLLSA